MSRRFCAIFEREKRGRRILFELELPQIMPEKEIDDDVDFDNGLDFYQGKMVG